MTLIGLLCPDCGPISAQDLKRIIDRQKSESPATPKLSDRASYVDKITKMIEKDCADKKPSTGEDWWEELKRDCKILQKYGEDTDYIIENTVIPFFRSLLQKERDKVEEIRQLRQDDFARRRTLTKFAVMAERERCAKICEETKMEEPHLSNTDRGYLWNRALDAAKQQILKDNQ